MGQVSFRRSRFRGSPAQKNVTQWIANAVGAATANAQDFVIASGTPDGLNDVEYPSTVKMIFLDVTLTVDAVPATPSQQTLIIWKNQGTQGTNPTHAQLVALGNWAGNSKVLFTVGNMQSNTANVLRYRGWVRIPRRHQIFNENDVMTIVASNAIGAWSWCGVVIYKWRQ